ncbi:hypothetical protein C8J56DRAFT_927399 [Mycena floridula]|nr:hypothetical protein C8J56DRAFT_927399 [Mycena floridula]
MGVREVIESDAVVHIVKDMRGPLPDMVQCPPYIVELASYLASSPSTSTTPDSLQVYSSIFLSPQDYFGLWDLILCHWFPQTEGYKVHQDWFHSSGQPEDDVDPQSHISFAVTHTWHPSSPVLILQVSSPCDYSNIHLKEAAAHLTTTTQFEMIAPYSPFKEIVTIAAMGKSFKAIRRETALTAAEAIDSIGTDWLDDVASDVGWNSLANLLEGIKDLHQVPPIRPSRRGRRARNAFSGMMLPR